MRFRILGNGAFGCALYKIFNIDGGGGENPDVMLEDSLVGRYDEFTSGDIMIPAVPSDAVCLVVEQALKFGTPDAIMLVSKGVATNQLLTEDMKKYDLPILYFAGPNFAKEIEFNLDFLSATLAGPSELTVAIKKRLNGVIIDTTQDLILPQVAAIMKNVTAFVIGYLNTTQNARASLIMQGMKEAVSLANKLGSHEGKILRACFSDFILTCTSENSRNFQAGRDFRNNTDIANSDLQRRCYAPPCDISPPGVKNDTYESLKSIDNLYAIRGSLKMPLVEFFCKLVKKNECDAKALFYDMATETKSPSKNSFTF